MCSSCVGRLVTIIQNNQHATEVHLGDAHPGPQHSSSPWRYSDEGKRENTFPHGADILVDRNGK